MREHERRKRYQDHDVSTQAPSKLIGYVSAGSFETPGVAPPLRRTPRGRAVVVLLALGLVAIWLSFGGV